MVGGVGVKIFELHAHRVGPRFQAHVHLALGSGAHQEEQREGENDLFHSW
jgi:hypothetical protein